MADKDTTLQRAFYHRLGEQSDRRLAEVDARAKQRMTEGLMTGTEIAHAQGREGREAARPYFEAAMRPTDRAMGAIDGGHVRQPIAVLTPEERAISSVEHLGARMRLDAERVASHDDNNER